MLSSIQQRPYLSKEQAAREDEIRHAFNGQVYIDNNLDVHTGKLWDCLRIKAGQEIGGGQTFFSNPANKSLVETNVRTPRRLDAPEAFSVQRILFVFSSNANPVDVYGVAESLVFRFWLSQKWHAEAPLIALPTSKAQVAPIRICTYCHAVYVQDRHCPGCGAREFKLSGLEEETGLQFFFEPAHPLVIVSQQSFYVSLEGVPWTAQSPFALWCYFEGLHARGVQ